MERPMNPYERRLVADAIEHQERALRRRHARGPSRDPVLAALLSIEGHADRPLAVRGSLAKLRSRT